MYRHPRSPPRNGQSDSGRHYHQSTAMLVVYLMLSVSKRPSHGAEPAACRRCCRRSARSSAEGQGHPCRTSLAYGVASSGPLLVLDDGDPDLSLRVLWRGPVVTASAAPASEDPPLVLRCPSVFERQLFGCRLFLAHRQPHRRLPPSLRKETPQPHLPFRAPLS